MIRQVNSIRKADREQNARGNECPPEVVAELASAI